MYNYDEMPRDELIKELKAFVNKTNTWAKRQAEKETKTLQTHLQEKQKECSEICQYLRDTIITVKELGVTFNAVCDTAELTETQIINAEETLWHQTAKLSVARIIRSIYGK